MGTSAVTPGLLPAVAPVSRRVRAYFAPVVRGTWTATMFDMAGMGTFQPDAPPAPWVELGTCGKFARKSGTKVEALVAGAPGVPVGQVRTEIEATVTLELDGWSKLALALTAGCQQMNVIRPAAVGLAVAVEAASAANSATSLDVGVQAAAGFSVGDLVAVDADYAGTTGFAGSGVAGGYVKSAAAIGTDADYVRRVTLNVGRVVAVNGGVLELGAPLLAGAPVVGMKVSPVVGFCDREGGSFFAEWSGLFVQEGVEGDRVFFFYPRLQAMTGAAEGHEALLPKDGLERMRLVGSFRGLPVVDALDGERVVCYRGYLPGAMRGI